jgi:EmrB/QacA subfamily drug resistance transporter
MANIGKPPCDEAAMMAAPCPEQSPIHGGWWVLSATILGSSMAFIDGTVVNVALPELQSVFAATVSEVQWVVESYALILAALLLPGGALGDIYGRRKIFAAGVVVFGLSSAWCGCAPNISALIAARALQGLGAALLVPGSLALISASFPIGERGRAIGTWSGFTAITAAIGPVLGGWLIQHESWRWAFFINLPIAAIVIALTLLRVPESRRPGNHANLDWLGATLAIVGLGGIVFALIEPSHRLAALSAGVVASVAFVFVEKRSTSPMLPFSLFQSRAFTGANLLTLFLYAAFSGVLFFLPLNLIQIQRYPATQAGAALLPLILLIFVLSRWSGGLVARYGAKLPLVIGPAIAGAGFALLAVPAVGGSYWITFFPAIVVLGIGMAVSVAPLTTTVMNSIPQSLAGTASGINNAASRIAGLLAIAALGFLLITEFNHDLDDRLDTLSLPSGIRQQIDSQRPKLAAIQTANVAAREAIAQSFITGFRTLLCVSVGLSLAASLSAAVFIDKQVKQI